MEDNEKKAPSCCDAKVVLVGESGVGKTSIIKQFTRGIFDEEMYSSTSSQFTTKIINVPDTNKAIRFDLWDTAGQEKYRSLAKIFYKDSKVIVFVYDMTNKKSFEDIQSYWYNEVKSNCKEDSLFVIVGNKLDLYNYKEIEENDPREWAKSIGVMYFETSAKINAGIDDLFEKVAKKILSPNYDFNKSEQREKELYEKKQKIKKKYKDEGDVEEEKNDENKQKIKLDKKHSKNNKKGKKKFC